MKTLQQEIAHLLVREERKRGKVF